MPDAAPETRRVRGFRLPGMRMREAAYCCCGPDGDERRHYSVCGTPCDARYHLPSLLHRQIAIYDAGAPIRWGEAPLPHFAHVGQRQALAQEVNDG